MPKGEIGPALNRRPLGLACVAGLLYYLGFCPLSWWPLTFAGAALLVGLLDAAPTARDAALRAVVMKAVALMPTVPYLSGLGIAVHVVAVGAHVACWGLMGAAFWHARSRFGSVTALLSLPALWTLAEWLGTVKHFLPSHVTTWSQALAVPALGLAPYTGALGVSTVAVSAAIAPWVIARSREALTAGRRAELALAAAGFAALWGGPVVGRLAHGPTPGSTAPPLRVSTFSLIANDAMEEYLGPGTWTPQHALSVEKYIRKRTGELRELLRGQTPELVVLPEDAMDFVLPDSRSAEAYTRFGIENNGALIEAYRDLARSVGAGLAIGLTTIRGERRYNTTLFIGKDGALRGLRDKWKLTPGSEYWPAPAWLPVWLLFAGDRQYVDPDRQHTPAAEPFPLLTKDPWPTGSVVCLEGHMPKMYLGWRRAGAELVLFMGNAHWFHWDPGTFNIQLLRTVRLSAAAYGLPVVMTGKANNAGAMSPDGTLQIWPWVPDGGKEQAHEVLVPRAPAGLTLAARWGEYYLPLSAAMIPALLALAWLLRLRRAE